MALINCLPYLQGVSDPTVDDWIAVYTPVFVNLTYRTPIKFIMCAQSASHLSTGAGNVTFRLLNMRNNYLFALGRSGVGLLTRSNFRGPYVTPAALSNVVVLTEELQDQPSMVHLALSGNPTEMVVVWTTKTLGTPIVEYGRTSAAPLSIATATSATYAALDMCPDGPADSSGFIDPGRYGYCLVFSGTQHPRKLSRDPGALPGHPFPSSNLTRFFGTLTSPHLHPQVL